MEGPPDSKQVSVIKQMIVPIDWQSQLNNHTRHTPLSLSLSLSLHSVDRVRNIASGEKRMFRIIERRNEKSWNFPSILSFFSLSLIQFPIFIVSRHSLEFSGAMLDRSRTDARQSR